MYLRFRNPFSPSKCMWFDPEMDIRDVLEEWNALTGLADRVIESGMENSPVLCVLGKQIPLAMAKYTEADLEEYCSTPGLGTEMDREKIRLIQEKLPYYNAEWEKRSAYAGIKENEYREYRNAGPIKKWVLDNSITEEEKKAQEGKPMLTCMGKSASTGRVLLGVLVMAVGLIIALNLQHSERPEVQLLALLLDIGGLVGGIAICRSGN